MTLKEWFKKFHNRPLKIAAGFLLAIWFVFSIRSYFVIEEKHLEAVNQTGDLLTFTLQSKDLVITESLLQSLLSQGGATSAILCKANTQLTSANEDLSGCSRKTSLTDKMIEKTLVGTGGIVLKVRFSMLRSLSPIFSVLGFGLILVFSGFYFIQIAQRRIEKDIFGPLFNKLLSDDKLEIRELNDLRERVIHAKELEAQKAVTLAIQENNRQVAHDIRSPVDSIKELLKQIEIQDPKINNALDIAIMRANSIANSLLSSEVQSDSFEKAPTYDVSDILRNIAAEKMPLFGGGHIEVTAPKHQYVTTALSSNSLARVLSNIVDNAMLACEQAKSIKISCHREADAISIVVCDTGRGIQPENLDRIGEKGFSVRDKTQTRGIGRGVYSAKNTIEKIGGFIDFESTVGVGTKVTMKIPVNPFNPVGDVDLILVDNEKIVRLMWEIGASNSGLKCKIFSSIDELLVVSDSISKTTPIFLDSNLDGSIKGEDFAPILRGMGFQRILLATSYAHLHGTAVRHIDAVVGKSFDTALKSLKADDTGMKANLC